MQGCKEELRLSVAISNNSLNHLIEKNIDDRHGHGLELAVMKKLVEVTGDQISLTSRLGQGNEFRVSAPQSK